MIKVLISACLLGERVRYDGKQVAMDSPILVQWQKEGRLIPFCPEVAGGLAVPRSPAEIRTGDGNDVLTGKAKIFNFEQVEVTANFLKGSRQVIRFFDSNLIKLAILKSLSPACSINEIYDGTFSRRIKRGLGVFAAFLKSYPIKLFAEYELETANQYLLTLEKQT
jgi:uncharacterized protein YbbK (DUF523 family)